jgi:deoxyadenosine/deoxycytidine kinase
MIISVEGNIGAGKSTLLNKLKEIMDVEIHLETLDNTFLEKLRNFNIDPQRYAQPLQEHITSMRENLMSEIYGDDKIHIIERSVISDKAFSSTMLENQHITQRFYNLYTHRINAEIFKHPLDMVIYLKTDPERSFFRQFERGREEESSVDLQYITQLNKHHNIWIPNYVEYYNIKNYVEINYNNFSTGLEEIKYALRKRNVGVKG